MSSLVQTGEGDIERDNAAGSDTEGGAILPTRIARVGLRLGDDEGLDPGVGLRLGLFSGEGVGDVEGEGLQRGRQAGFAGRQCVGQWDNSSALYRDYCHCTSMYSGQPLRKLCPTG